MSLQHWETIGRARTGIKQDGGRTRWKVDGIRVKFGEKIDICSLCILKREWLIVVVIKTGIYKSFSRDFAKARYSLATQAISTSIKEAFALLCASNDMSKNWPNPKNQKSQRPTPGLNSDISRNRRLGLTLMWQSFPLASYACAYACVA